MSEALERVEQELLQLAHVSAISKLLMCIEGLFVLMYAVRRPYPKLPRYLTRYQTSQIDAILEMIAKKQTAVFCRILGWPNLKYLRLDRNDRKIVWSVMNQDIETAMTALTRIRDFYLNHLIVYWKFKHGLSLLLGASVQGQPPVESLMYAFDRNSERPKGHSIEMAESFPSDFNWFNIVQMVPFTERAFQNITEVLNGVRRLTLAITNNHLTWAENCGQDYLPAKREGDQARAYAHGEFSNEVREAYGRIFLRVASNMTLATRTIRFNFNFANEAGKEGSQRLVGA